MKNEADRNSPIDDNVSKDKELREKFSEIDNLKKKLADLEEQIIQKNKELKEKEKIITEKNAIIEVLENIPEYALGGSFDYSNNDFFQDPKDQINFSNPKKNTPNNQEKNLVSQYVQTDPDKEFLQELGSSGTKNNSSNTSLNKEDPTPTAGKTIPSDFTLSIDALTRGANLLFTGNEARDVTKTLKILKEIKNLFTPDEKELAEQKTIDLKDLLQKFDSIGNDEQGKVKKETFLRVYNPNANQYDSHVLRTLKGSRDDAGEYRFIVTDAVRNFMASLNDLESITANVAESSNTSRQMTTRSDFSLNLAKIKQNTGIPLADNNDKKVKKIISDLRNCLEKFSDKNFLTTQEQFDVETLNNLAKKFDSLTGEEKKTFLMVYNKSFCDHTSYIDKLTSESNYPTDAKAAINNAVRNFMASVNSLRTILDDPLYQSPTPVPPPVPKPSNTSSFRDNLIKPDSNPEPIRKSDFKLTVDAIKSGTNLRLIKDENSQIDKTLDSLNTIKKIKETFDVERLRGEQEITISDLNSLLKKFDELDDNDSGRAEKAIFLKVYNPNANQHNEHTLRTLKGSNDSGGPYKNLIANALVNFIASLDDLESITEKEITDFYKNNKSDLKKGPEEKTKTPSNAFKVFSGDHLLNTFGKGKF